MQNLKKSIKKKGVEMFADVKITTYLGRVDELLKRSSKKLKPYSPLTSGNVATHVYVYEEQGGDRGLALGAFQVYRNGHPDTTICLAASGADAQYTQETFSSFLRELRVTTQEVQEPLKTQMLRDLMGFWKN
ncbi:MAG: hypothetical protein AABX14_02625 [Candidatus Aenigmatarchaeota archaeon]